MIEYIKRPYNSPIAGVTNTETGWKLTSDVEGLVIIDEVPVSAITVDRYVSNIVIPVNVTVYIWYKMKLSNGEEKQYVGPHEYISTDSSSTNDLKPITRVETPTVSVAGNSIANGQPIITFSSSGFRGDPLDGHYASTWIMKSPSGDIIQSSTFSQTDKYEFKVNRITKDLARFSTVDVFIKHHSGNGANSEFSKTTFELNVYPFKYEGPLFVDSLLPYVFTIVPNNPAIPNVEKIEIEHIVTKEVVFSTSVVNNLTFTVPPGQLEEGNTYIVNAYVLNRSGPSFTYYPKLETKIQTITQKDSMTYTKEVEYDIMAMEANPYFTLTHKAVGAYRVVKGKAIVRTDTGLSLLRKIGPNFTSEDLTVHTSLTSYITDDMRIFNLRQNRALIVTRTTTAIRIAKIVEVNNVAYLDATYPVKTIAVKNVNHRLDYTSAVCLDEAHLYLTYISPTNELTVDLIDVEINETVRKPNRPDITALTYDPTKFLVTFTGYDEVTSIGIVDGKLVNYAYSITNDTWILRSIIDDVLVSGLTVQGITLRDLSVLLTKTTTNTSEIIHMDNLHNANHTSAPVNLTDYTLSLIDTDGSLSIFNPDDAKVVVIRPTMII